MSSKPSSLFESVFSLSGTWFVIWRVEWGGVRRLRNNYNFCFYRPETHKFITWNFIFRLTNFEIFSCKHLTRLNFQPNSRRFKTISYVRNVTLTCEFLYNNFFTPFHYFQNSNGSIERLPRTFKNI